MRVLLSLLLLVGISSAAGAQTIERIEITEVGIFKTQTTKVNSAPGTPTGTFEEVTDVKLLQATTTVPARVGVGVDFGFGYKIVGQTGSKVRLKFVTLIPQPGIRNPNSGNTIVRSEYFEEKIVGSTSYTIYGLDNPWEIVIGTWTLEIWEDNRKLASQSFNIVAP